MGSSCGKVQVTRLGRPQPSQMNIASAKYPTKGSLLLENLTSPKSVMWHRALHHPHVMVAMFLFGLLGRTHLDSGRCEAL